MKTLVEFDFNAIDAEPVRIKSQIEPEPVWNDYKNSSSNIVA